MMTRSRSRTAKLQKLVENGNHDQVSPFISLPSAVIYEILFRLSINSIIKAKLVCKLFYQLISQPYFALNYSKKSPFSTVLFPQLTGVLNLIEFSDNCECVRTTFKPKIPGLRSNSKLSLEASCNGLLCLSLRKGKVEKPYICNPIRGDCIPLPKSKLKRWGNGDGNYGFGFCKSSNNYKLLRMVCTQVEYGLRGECEILTVGVDKRWRHLPNLTILFSYQISRFVAFNGVLYWLLQDTDSVRISTFDFGEQKLGHFSPPPGLVISDTTGT